MDFLTNLHTQTCSLNKHENKFFVRVKLQNNTDITWVVPSETKIQFFTKSVQNLLTNPSINQILGI